MVILQGAIRAHGCESSTESVNRFKYARIPSLDYLACMWLTIFAACSSSAPTKPPHIARRNVLLVVVDTLRSDAIAGAQTPELDHLKKSADSVDTAWSSSTWTVPSMISMFTGMPVRQHGWSREPGNVNAFPSIPPAPLLAEVLKKKGYGTTALYANDFLAPSLGFSRGFDSYDKIVDRQAPKRVAEAVAEWGPDQPEFLYVHLLGPHSPLLPSEAARSRHGVDSAWFEAHRLGFLIGAAKRNREPGVRDAYRDGYYAVVEDTDARIGEILDALGEHRQDTLIVLTSDHGELLGEHEVFGHGWWVYEPLAHVPLIVEGGVPLPETLSGASVPAIITESLHLEHRWPTAYDAPLLVTQRKDKLAISVNGREKAIWDGSDAELFDLESDPGELSGSPVSEALVQARAAFEARTPAGRYSEDQVQLHQDTTEALQSLGYLGGPE